MTDTKELYHYGILRRSGRYPWGSGGTVIARSRNFLGVVDSLRAKGMSEVDIAKGFGMTTTELRAARAIAKNEARSADAVMAVRLQSKGLSHRSHRQENGLRESSVRSLLLILRFLISVMFFRQ